MVDSTDDEFVDARGALRDALEQVEGDRYHDLLSQVMLVVNGHDPAVDCLKEVPVRMLDLVYLQQLATIGDIMLGAGLAQSYLSELDQAHSQRN